MSEKPEWFEMAAEEKAPSQPGPKKIKRVAKIALLTAPLLLIGGAMVFAEGDESDDAPAMDTTIPTATVSSSTANTQANSSNSIKVTQVTSKSTNSKTVNGVANPASNNVPNSPAKGVGVPAPSGRGGEEHEGRERPHHEGGEHEGGEHEFGGDDD